jgi:hypothetical protein
VGDLMEADGGGVAMVSNLSSFSSAFVFSYSLYIVGG